MDILDRSQTDRRGQDRRLLAQSLTQAIWDLGLGRQPSEAEFCLQHYDFQSTMVDRAMAAPRTHRDVLEIVQHLKDAQQQTLNDLAKVIVGKTPPPAWLNAHSIEAAEYCLRFAASLWLFTDAAGWLSDQTLEAFVKRSAPIFSPQKSDTDNQVLHLHARSLVRIAGFEIRWTSNIMDHLRLDMTDPKTPQLFCFRHACFLSNSGPRLSSDIFPAHFLRETALTLALLFPSTESPSRRWDRRIRRKADLDVEPGLAYNTPRNLEYYTYYRARLQLIAQTFDRAQPGTIRQWLHDKRSSDKFYTFWLAVLAIVLTLLFGLVQSVTGVLQVIRR